MEPIVVQIIVERDVIIARQKARDLARSLDFRLADQTRLATAISELTRNVIMYAGRGTCTIRDVSKPPCAMIQVDVEDNGPGIPDIEKAMTYGYTTGNGLGAGLPGSKRLVHEFSLESRPGFTRISVKMKGRRCANR